MKDIEKLATVGRKSIISNIKKEIRTIKLYFEDYKYVSALGSHHIPNAINRYREARQEAIDCGMNVKEFDNKVAMITINVKEIPLFKKVDFNHYVRMSLILDANNKDLN